MKFEWKKQEKNLYLPKEELELITVPQQKFFMIRDVQRNNKSVC